MDRYRSERAGVSAAGHFHQLADERGQQRFEHDPTRYLPGNDGVAMMHRDQQTTHQDCRQEGSAKHLAGAEEGQT